MDPHADENTENRYEFEGQYYEMSISLMVDPILIKLLTTSLGKLDRRPVTLGEVALPDQEDIRKKEDMVNHKINILIRLVDIFKNRERLSLFKKFSFHNQINQFEGKEEKIF
ncbi:MAG: hypothetical protein LBH19_07265 [Dysgonamonadaceae bacterium]|jgi:hypothetical protein|nr:hypothetical protein [Dysgonamonadaceae bacterium]